MGTNLLTATSNAFASNLSEISNTSDIPYIVVGIALIGLIALAPVIADYIGIKTASRSIED